MLGSGGSICYDKMDPHTLFFPGTGPETRTRTSTGTRSGSRTRAGTIVVWLVLQWVTIVRSRGMWRLAWITSIMSKVVVVVSLMVEFRLWISLVEELSSVFFQGICCSFLDSKIARRL